MSFKRKTTKPIRVSDENGQNSSLEMPSYDFSSTSCDLSLNGSFNGSFDSDLAKAGKRLNVCCMFVIILFAINSNVIVIIS